MRSRSVARELAAVALSVAVVAAGCSDAPSSPTPALPPTASLPAIGILRVGPDAGPTDGGTVVQVTGNGFRAGATLWFDDIAVPITENTPTAITAVTPAHATGRVSVVVINPDGGKGQLERGFQFGVFSVSASPSVARPGDELTVSWVAPEGRGCNGGGDWIAIYKVGDPDRTGASNGHSDLWYDHVCGATTGTRTLTAPDPPGAYEFRYLVGDTSVARSQTVMVATR